MSCKFAVSRLGLGNAFFGARPLGLILSQPDDATDHDRGRSAWTAARYFLDKTAHLG